MLRQPLRHDEAVSLRNPIVLLGQTPIRRLRITQALLTPLPGFALLGITAGLPGNTPVVRWLQRLAHGRTPFAVLAAS